jgi:oligoribonuclease NrnB/cAMP/cGMP phosphodiesterase (DHH superfamily)
MIYSLSHIDLDGYGCQYILKNIFKENIYFENSNYGIEIQNKLKNILEKIDRKVNKKEKDKIIITDLNLTEEIAKFIDEEVKKRDFLELILIDHHKTGELIAEKYDWYLLNEEYCATYLTYLYFKEEIPETLKNELKAFSELVNITDLWKEKEEKFKIANFLSQQIFNGFRFPRFLNKINHEYKLYMIKEIFSEIQKNKNIREIESKLFFINESFLKNKIKDEFLLNEKESLDLKFYYLIYNEIKNFKFEKIKIGESEGKLIYSLGSGIFQYFADFYNTEIADVDFLLHIDERGKISMRSKGDNEKKDVSFIASKYFNGGGHFNASGGLLEPNNQYFKCSKKDVLKIFQDKGFLIETIKEKN